MGDTSNMGKLPEEDRAYTLYETVRGVAKAVTHVVIGSQGNIAGYDTYGYRPLLVTESFAKVMVRYFKVWTYPRIDMRPFITNYQAIPIMTYNESPQWAYQSEDRCRRLGPKPLVVDLTDLSGINDLIMRKKRLLPEHQLLEE